MNQKFVGIQILRFVAAMLVVVMHLTQAVSIHITGAGPDKYWAAGSAGVDIFFVISGFVMATSTGPSPSGLGDRIQSAWIFLKRRFLRIVPLYWFYTLAKAALLVALPGLASRSSIDPGHLTASLLFIPAMSPWGFVEPTLPVGWTLNFEMLFYGVFALAIALGVPRIRFCLLALMLVFFAGRYFDGMVPLAFYAQSIVFEFVLGICIAFYFPGIKAWPTWAGWLAMGIGLMLMFGINWGVSADRLLTWGCAAAFLVLGVLWLEPWTAATRLLSPLSFLGDASYSIYLSHTFVVPAVVLALRKMGVQDMLVVAPTVLLAVVLSGCASYLWLERPMTRRLKRLLFKAPTPSFQNREAHHAK
jgi:exopolysaccharide production protein ExoZ